jgi:hypothetical protein
MNDCSSLLARFAVQYKFANYLTTTPRTFVCMNTAQKHSAGGGGDPKLPLRRRFLPRADRLFNASQFNAAEGLLWAHQQWQSERLHQTVLRAATQPGMHEMPPLAVLYKQPPSGWGNRLPGLATGEPYWVAPKPKKDMIHVSGIHALEACVVFSRLSVYLTCVLL